MSDFYYLSQEFNANVLDLLNKEDFFPLTTGIALKIQRRLTQQR